MYQPENLTADRYLIGLRPCITRFLSQAKRVTLFQRPFIFFTIPHSPYSFVNKKSESILGVYHIKGGGGGGVKTVKHVNFL